MSDETKEIEKSDPEKSVSKDSDSACCYYDAAGSVSGRGFEIAVASPHVSGNRP